MPWGRNASQEGRDVSDPTDGSGRTVAMARLPSEGSSKIAAMAAKYNVMAGLPATGTNQGEGPSSPSYLGSSISIGSMWDRNGSMTRSHPSQHQRLLNANGHHRRRHPRRIRHDKGIDCSLLPLFLFLLSHKQV